MILGMGNDILEIGRMERELAQPGPDLRDELFTAEEIAYCERQRYPARHYAARFAAKEAFLKALNTGLQHGISWKDVGVMHIPDGAPQLVLSGEAGRIANARGVLNTFLSISHTSTVAMASVVLEG